MLKNIETKCHIYYNKITWGNIMEKLDLKTKIYLYLTNANIVKHEKIEKVKEKKELLINEKENNKNNVYIFKNHDEYKDYFLMYLNNVNDDLIDLAIYTKGKNGQIVALEGLCKHIILKRKLIEIYTEEKVKEIHARGNKTALEQVEEWESYDLCAPGDAIGSTKNRCHTYINCHACLLEYASHKLEYPKMDLKIINYEDESEKKKNKKI